MRIAVALLVLPAVAGAQLREKIIYTQQGLVSDFEIVATPKPAVKLTLKNPTKGTTIVSEYHPTQVRSFLTESVGDRMAAESLLAKTEIAGMDERIGDLSVELGFQVITTLMRTSAKRKVDFGLAMRAGDETAMLPLTPGQARAVLDALRRGARVADSMLAASGRTDPRADSIAQATKDSIADTLPMRAINISPALIEQPLFPQPIPASVKGFVLTAQFVVDSTGRVEKVTFAPTPDASYNKKIEAVLRSFRFRPGMTFNGQRIRAIYEMIYPF